MESVGPVRFGVDATQLIQNLNLRLVSHFDLRESHPDLTEIASEADVCWDTYEVSAGATRISVTPDGTVTSVLCCDELFLSGRNLLGLSLEEVRNILGEEDDFDEEHGALQYDELGITLWLNTGIVDAATCMGRIID